MCPITKDELVFEDNGYEEDEEIDPLQEYQEEVQRRIQVEAQEEMKVPKKRK